MRKLFIQVKVKLNDKFFKILIFDFITDKNVAICF